MAKKVAEIETRRSSASAVPWPIYITRAVRGLLRRAAGNICLAAKLYKAIMAAMHAGVARARQAFRQHRPRMKRLACAFSAAAIVNASATRAASHVAARPGVVGPTTGRVMKEYDLAP